MLPTPVRALCASAAVVLFLGAVAGLVLDGSALWVVAVFGAAVLTFFAMFAGAAPSIADLPRIDEQLGRFRKAMMLCFIGAALALLARSSSLGVALWLVAFLLLFFVAYYRMQRRMAVQSARDAG